MCRESGHPQHRDPIRDPHHVGKPVRNIHHGRAVELDSLDVGEELRGLKGRQGLGGLV